MPSNYMNNFLNETQNRIDFWFNNYRTLNDIFSVSPLGETLIINPNVLNHNLTSCYTSDRYPIDFDYFPEPYYGNPDDEIEKLAVILFYNPGPQIQKQHINSRGEGTFYNNYLQNELNYNRMSANLNFCDNTIKYFWKPKLDQLHDLLGFLNLSGKSLLPFFMDLIPWHSEKFTRLKLNRFTRIDTKIEFKLNVIIPAILNAKNSSVSGFVNSISNDSNKIVFFAVGANYSNNSILSSVGFEDITDLIPQHIDHYINNNTLVAGNNARIKVWKINSTIFNMGIEAHEDIVESDIYVLNLWTPNVGMNIPRNISSTICHILQNI